MSEKKLSRREMMRRTALGAIGFTIVPRFVLGGAGHTPPSEIPTKAVLGVGGMGRGHLRFPGARLLAVCDVDEKHLARALKQVEEEQGIKGVRGYKDFREVIDRDDVDIIHVATPPHWHALMALAAAEAGKDIWCEKPMTRTIAEGQAVVKAVQRNGRMLRINTSGRLGGNLYDLGMTTKDVRKLVINGVLGWPLRVTVSMATGFDWKQYWSGRTDLVAETPPAELDYDFWLGPAPWKPYHPHRVHQSFRGYWDYDGGGLGDMGHHYLDPVQYILGKDDTSPVEIEADSQLQHPDACVPWRRVEMKYADGCEIILDGGDSNEEVPYIEGPKAKLYKGGRCTAGEVEKILRTLPDPEPMITEFIESVKTRRKFALNEANGHRSCNLVNLAKIAVRVNRPLRFDPVKERFVNDAEANRLVEEPMRAPWHI